MNEVSAHREKGAQNFESNSRNRSGTLTGVFVDLTYGTGGISVSTLLGRICARRPYASRRMAATVTVSGEESRSREASANSRIWVRSYASEMEVRMRRVC